MKQKRFIQILILIAIIIGFVFVWMILVEPAKTEKFVEEHISKQGKQLEKLKEEFKKDNEVIIVEKKMKDEIELATIKLKINNVEEKQILGGGFGTPAIAKENTKFVIINLDITNTTNSGFTFFPETGFILIDNKEREFTTYKDTIWKVDNYLNVRELAPDITENGVLVYEIPKDAENYSLMIAKGGTNEIYKISL